MKKKKQEKNKKLKVIWSFVQANCINKWNLQSPQFDQGIFVVENCENPILREIQREDDEGTKLIWY